MSLRQFISLVYSIFPRSSCMAVPFLKRGSKFHINGQSVAVAVTDNEVRDLFIILSKT